MCVCPINEYIMQEGVFKLLHILHSGKLTWNPQITFSERKLFSQTSMIMFYVNLQGCYTLVSLRMFRTQNKQTKFDGIFGRICKFFMVLWPHDCIMTNVGNSVGHMAIIVSYCGCSSPRLKRMSARKSKHITTTRHGNRETRVHGHTRGARLNFFPSFGFTCNMWSDLIRWSYRGRFMMFHQCTKFAFN